MGFSLAFIRGKGPLLKVKKSLIVIQMGHIKKCVHADTAYICIQHVSIQKFVFTML